MILEPRRPQVVDEVFDAETVVVHLESGCYYSLDAAATALWGLLSQGTSVDRLVELSGLPHAEVDAFVSSLVAEDLLVPAAVDGTHDAAAVVVDATPGFDRFTDMQDLLLIDPVHDIAIDGDGWPVAL